MKCGDLAVACAQTSEKQDRKRSVVNQSRANPSPVSFSLITGKKTEKSECSNRIRGSYANLDRTRRVDWLRAHSGVDELVGF
jgi:hypothetical protein